MHCLLDKNNSQTQTFFYSTVSGQEERLACIATITCNKLLCQTSSGYNVCGPILVSDPAHADAGILGGDGRRFHL